MYTTTEMKMYKFQEGAINASCPILSFENEHVSSNREIICKIIYGVFIMLAF
jgi:hypothetical protein